MLLVHSEQILEGDEHSAVEAALADAKPALRDELEHLLGDEGSEVGVAGTAPGFWAELAPAERPLPHPRGVTKPGRPRRAETTRRLWDPFQRSSLNRRSRLGYWSRESRRP